MKRGYLSQFFEGVAAKRLSAVEVAPDRSNQHEFNGSRALVDLLGSPKSPPDRFPTLDVYLDDSGVSVVDSGEMTWYDSRERHPTRSEPRLYYRGSLVFDRMAEGDLLVLGRRQGGAMIALIARAESSALRQLEWLFGIETVTQSFTIVGEDKFDARAVEYAAASILESLGIEAILPDDSLLGEMLKRFGGMFPLSRDFSAFARQHSGIESPGVAAADHGLMSWLEREERYFRALEEHLVSERIRVGFSSVDDFMSFSLSVQNRRKSRAGRALENHLESLFESCGIRVSRGQVTERTSRPDFVFPGIREYRDSGFPAARLTMLASKSTCKDRWRQILTEADRIPAKHLITLEPAISENQTAEMRAASVSLVVPEPLHHSYRATQLGWMLTVRQFLELVGDRQQTS